MIPIAKQPKSNKKDGFKIKYYTLTDVEHILYKMCNLITNTQILQEQGITIKPYFDCDGSVSIIIQSNDYATKTRIVEEG